VVGTFRRRNPTAGLRRASPARAADAGELRLGRRGRSDREAAPGAANPWPAIDVIAESYCVRGREIGRSSSSPNPRGTSAHRRMTLATTAAA